MIDSVKIEDFRSIESADVALAPITVLYGATASGKSSLFYAILTLRNFLLNPNQASDAFLNLGFMSLGSFDDCVFNHLNRYIQVGITESAGGKSSSYEAALWKTTAKLELKSDGLILTGVVAVPYALNQTFPFTQKIGDDEYNITWNGIAATVAPNTPTDQTQKIAQQIARQLNRPAEAIKAIDIAPARRGFFKPNYSPSQISNTPTTEDEVASLIINDPNRAARIASYIEDIFQRDFRTYTPPGTATVFFQTIDKKSKTPGLLVNDGFGVNQVVYLLAKMYRPEVKTLLIEEPEVHLHPIALRNLARAMCEFAIQENKQLVFTTHSELFLASILTVVSEGHFKFTEILSAITQ